MKLSYEVIVAAVSGDRLAIETVLKKYKPFILFLSMIVYRDENGGEKKLFSPDARQTLQKKLIEEIPKWKEICK